MRAVPERLASVHTTDVVEYPNGDVAQYLDLNFRCRAAGGQARVNDDESLDVGWFAPDGLPDLGPLSRMRIKHALADGPTWFELAPPAGPADQRFR